MLYGRPPKCVLLGKPLGFLTTVEVTVGNIDIFLDTHRAFNRRFGGARQEDTSRLARVAGFPSGRYVCWMFRQSILVTRPDGRWVADM